MTVKHIAWGVIIGTILLAIAWWVVWFEVADPAPSTAVLVAGDNFELTNEHFIIRAPLTDEDMMTHDVAAHAPDGPHSAWSYHPVVAPVDMWVTGIKVSVNNASSDIIHHLSFGVRGEAGTVCSDTTYSEYKEYYTVSRTNIHEAINFPSPYGLHITAGEALMLTVMTHILEPPHGPGHMSDEPVTVEIELSLASVADTRTQPLEFVRLRLDDSPCANPNEHQAFVVPAHTTSYVRQADETTQYRSASYTFPYPSVVLTRSANLWGTKGGKTLTVLKNGELAEVFHVYQGELPWQWYIDAAHEPYLVQAGDTVSIEATYTNPHDTPIMDASGMFGFYYGPL